MARKITLIKLFVVTGNFLIPVYAFFLYFTCLKTFQGFLFFLLFSAAIIERAWETFKTSREKHRDEFHGDWTLAAVTTAYIGLFFAFITEFYLFVKSADMFITSVGFLFLGISLRMRFWGMTALGKQWAVHAVGAQKIRKVRLIKIGPYRYVRHPIYLGIILECIAFPIIANTPYSFLIALAICVPLVVIRARTEEKASMRRFGEKYSKYKQEVGMFFPTQIFHR